MKISITEKAKTILSNPHGLHAYFGWPTVARLQNGNLAVVCSGFRMGHVCPFGKLVMAISENEGETWTPPFPLIDTPLDDRDGGICVFGPGGVMVTSFNNSILAQRNWNPGNKYYNAYLDLLTEEDEKNYLGSQFRLSTDGGKTFGPIFRAPVTSPHGPTALSDGTLLWAGCVFSEDDSFGENSGVHVYRVNTNGTMDFIGAVPNVYENGERVYLCEPHCTELPDGSLICHIRSEGKVEFGTYQTRSFNKGKTWTKPELILPAYGGAPCHLLLHSSGVLISAYGFRQPPYGIRVMLSEDNGNSWQKDMPLWEGVSSDLGYPATAQLPDGSLLTVFYAKDDTDGPAVIKQVKWKLQ